MTKKLDADAVNAVCALLISTDDSDALWVSSLAIRAAMNRRPRTRLKRTLGLDSGWPPSDVAFFPLHDNNHWSLLVMYRSKGLNHLYHYDSVPGCHATHAIGVVSMLCEGGLLKEKEIRIHRVADFPVQKSTWECGWYLIRAVQMVLVASKGGGLTQAVTGSRAKKLICLPVSI